MKGGEILKYLVMNCMKSIHRKEKLHLLIPKSRYSRKMNKYMIKRVSLSSKNIAVRSMSSRKKIKMVESRKTKLSVS